ncbi:MAG: 3-isopropylmalate dehydratase small subunit [Thermoleophilia bacterium]|nr:3-isopropylmalate dehydratase small subunit [Thermoleophilia bacterium]
MGADKTATVVLRLGDDVSTDAIYPGRFMATVLPTETPQHCFADLTEFNARLRDGVVPPGSVIVADRNFGTGSSREQAASCLKGWDLIVVANNFSRIFMQNAVNLGLRLVICPGIEASEGDELEFGAEAVTNVTTGMNYPVELLPPARQAIVDAGGLIPYIRKRVVEERAG